MRPVWLAVALIALPAFAAGNPALDRATAAFNAGQPRTARAELTAALKADPGSALAHAMLGRVWLALGDGVAAEAELLRARDSGFARDDLRHLLAHAYELTGRPARALAQADRAVVPERFAAYAARVRGRALTALGDRAAASAEFDRALALAPNLADTWIDVARYRMAAADQAGAVAAADRALALAPARAEPLVLKGLTVRNQYGLVASLPWFERALALDTDHVPAMLEAAATYGDIGRARDMLAMTRRVLALDARNPQAWYLQSMIAARARRFDLARALLARTGGALDGVPATSLLAATLDIQTGSHQQAIARLERLLQTQPDNLGARRLLGLARARGGDNEGAIAALRPLADRADADLYTLALIGRAHEALGDRVVAARYLDAAVRPGARPLVILSPGGSDGNPRVQAIREAIASGRAGDALAGARTLQRENPGTPAAHILAGDVLGALGRYGEAAQAYAQAANIAFSESVALRMFDALERSGQPDAAIGTLQLFLAQNPRNIAALSLVAGYWQRRGDWPRAIAVLEGLRARTGNRDALILHNLAWAYFNSRAHGKALVFARAAYALAPGNPATGDALGWFLLTTPDTRDAMALLAKAHRQAPGDPAMHWGRAQKRLARR